MNLDFTMTACRRPEILRRTLESFQRNLLGVDWERSSLFINVDPIGNAPAESIDLPRFGSIHFTRAKVPNFPAALKQVWSEATLCPGHWRCNTDFLFHLEDDWELLEPVNVLDLVSILLADPTDPSVVCVNLRHRSDFAERMDLLLLAPGLWRREIVAVLAELLSADTNPEMQLWDKASGTRCRLFPADRSRVIVRDIGREWLKASGLRKNAEQPCDPAFVKWIP